MKNTERFEGYLYDLIDKHEIYIRHYTYDKNGVYAISFIHNRIVYELENNWEHGNILDMIKNYSEEHNFIWQKE